MLCFGCCFDAGQGSLSKTQQIDCSAAGTGAYLGPDNATATSAKPRKAVDSVTVCDGHIIMYQDPHGSNSETSTSSDDGQLDQKHPRPVQAAQSLAPTATAPHTAAAAAVTAADPAVLYPYIVQHGRGILSLSTLQEGLQHFVMPGVGYIAYAMMYNGPELLNIRTPVVLGDPMCDVSHYDIIARAFLDAHARAMFMQIGAGFARVLCSHGMLVNSLGGETHLDLATYTFSGYAKRGLRSAITSAAKEGITVEEVMHAPITADAVTAAAVISSSSADVHATAAAAAAVGQRDSLAAEMQCVDGEWLSRKGQHAGRVWFLNRQPVFAPEPGVRKLVARDRAGGLLGFIFFDAVYEGGQLAGYYANVTRMRPDAHPGVLNLVVKEFLDRVRAESQLSAPVKKLSVKKSLRKKLEQQQEPDASTASSSSTSSSGAAAAAAGARFISLGLSPLHQMDDSIFVHSKRVRTLFELSFRQGSGYYPFKPLAAAKAKYGAGLHDGKYEDPAVKYQQVYLAHSHHRLAAVAMFDLGKFLGFWKHPADAARSFFGYKLMQGVRRVEKKVRKLKGQRNSSSASSSSGVGGGVSSSGITGSTDKLARNTGNTGDNSSSTTTSAGRCLSGSNTTNKESSRNSASSPNSSRGIRLTVDASTAGASASSRTAKHKLSLVHPIIPPLQASSSKAVHQL